MGLTCDGEIDTAMYNLYSASNIYYTNDSFYSSYPFPAAWMQIFNKEQTHPTIEMEYEPVISPKQVLSPRSTRRIAGLRASSTPGEVPRPLVSRSSKVSRRPSVDCRGCRLPLLSKEKMRRTLLTELGGPSTLTRRMVKSSDRKRRGIKRSEYARGDLIGRYSKRNLCSVDISSDIINYLDNHRISDYSHSSSTKRYSTTLNSPK
eukprot:TRINITY_DN9447_c0_g2_i7.p1 TRINITY_DN9447_c0_g2~~TRINITY_DN9447_c0_g2_i7.p1  ORF type:complete len:205 (+),score=39.44 TRINITY_DN9447_c0_g2_i7:521-1135(+)